MQKFGQQRTYRKGNEAESARPAGLAIRGDESIVDLREGRPNRSDLRHQTKTRTSFSITWPNLAKSSARSSLCVSQGRLPTSAKKEPPQIFDCQLTNVRIKCFDLECGDVAARLTRVVMTFTRLESQFYFLFYACRHTLTELGCHCPDKDTSLDDRAHASPKTQG